MLRDPRRGLARGVLPQGAPAGSAAHAARPDRGARADVAPRQGRGHRRLLRERDLRNSQIAATTLETLGYGDVRVYVEGKKDWIEASMPVETAKLAS